MLAIEKTRRGMRELPILTRLGLAIVLAGLGLDVVAHVAWSAAAATGHLVTLAGMAIAFAGTMTLALRPTDRSRPGRSR